MSKNVEKKQVSNLMNPTQPYPRPKGFVSFPDTILEYNGFKKTVRTWAFELELTTNCIQQRLRKFGKDRMDLVLAPAKRKTSW